MAFFPPRSLLRILPPLLHSAPILPPQFPSSPLRPSLLPPAHTRPVPLPLIILTLFPPTVLLPISLFTLPPFLLSLPPSTPSFSAYVYPDPVRSSSIWVFNVCMFLFSLPRPLGS